MRFKSRTWFLLSLLLFAASFWTWQYGEKRYQQAQRHAAPPAGAVSPAGPSHPSAAPALTPTAHKTAQPGSYRLTNTGQTAGQLARNNHGIILRNALIDTARPVHLPIPAHLRAKGAPGSYIVQSDRALDQAFYDELTKIGATNVAYIPNNAALVQATPEQAKEMVQDPAFQAVLPWEPYYKLDSALLPTAVEQEPETNALRVVTFPGQLNAAIAALTGLGATVVGQDSSPFGPSIVVQAPAGTLAAVAQLPLAWEVETYTPRRALNDLTRVAIGVSTNTLTNAPNYLNLYGSNIWININDTGVDATHPDFSNRVSGLQVDFDGHGTHVAGSIAGSGAVSGTVTNPVPGSIIPGADFRGKAKQAHLFVQGLDLVLGPFDSDAALQSNASYALTTGAKTNGSVITNGFISNNSWGYQSMLYDTAAASYDAAVRDSQPTVPGEQAMLFVFAAGNNGGGSGSGVDGLEDSITSPATAKNVITVGSVDSPRFITNEVSYDGINTNEVFLSSTDNSNLVAYFSSCGNVGIGSEGEFGRFKPDVVAPGVFIVSCRASNYMDPSNELTLEYLDMPSQLVNPGKTNILPILLPVDTVSLTIQIAPNALSPNPFPPLQIQSGPNNPPGGPVGTNLVTVTNNLAQGFWYISVIDPIGQPVSYDLKIYIYQTNTLGDYYTVLSNMNSTLKPYYRYETGTSMSAGAVSGMLALMQQFLQANFPTHPDPSPALLKALLINGARSLGTLYDFNPQPSGGNEQGWGQVNIQNSIPASITNGNPSLWFSDQSPTNALFTGQSISYTLNCSDPNASNNPVRVTLVWTDPPGNPAAGIALVNNLELTVVDSTKSNLYVGNDFHAGDIFTELSEVTNPAPADVINNVQNIYLAPPINFPLTITVGANRVNVNAVTTQTNQIEQDFALVVSSDDTNLTAAFDITPNPVISVTSALITVANSGVPLLHQRVGANEPNLYNDLTGQTNGSLSQWHFFVFTNNQFSGTNQATNVLFATFYPPNLSVPRQSGADLDLYVSQKAGLTNLVPSVVNAALKSLNRGGNEFIYLSNSTPNAVYYIGVKSEDQQAADFGFYSVAQQAPFSSVNLQTGDVTYYGTPIPATIPDGSFDFPGQVTILVAFQGQYNVRKVSVLEGIAHQSPGDLVGTLSHPPSTASVFLNNHSGQSPGFTNDYDDLPENPGVYVSPSDGPGSLRDFVGQPAAGEWQLSVVDNALGGGGSVTAFDVTVSPAPPINGPITIQLAANGGSYFNYIDVPNDALYLTNVVIFQNQGTGGPIGIFMTNFNDVHLGDYGVSNINPPGGELVLGPTNKPPLSGGTWYYEIYNFGNTPVTLTNYIYFLTSLTPNLVESFSNNTVTPLTTDATTTSQICISNGQQVVDLQVGLRIADPNLDDLAIHLISPQGTSVMLFENRGGLLASNLGLTVVSTNSTNLVYTVFTENTNLTTTPIKFAPPPYASTNAITGVTTNVLANFDSIAAGTYTNGQTANGWTVLSNEVGVVADAATAYSGANFLALPNARIAQTFATLPGARYELRYQARGPGIAHWYPGNQNPDDIVSGNNGTMMNGASYAAGEVGQAFSLLSDQYVAVPDSTNFHFSSLTSEEWVNFSYYPPLGASGPTSEGILVAKPYAPVPDDWDSFAVWVQSGTLNAEVYNVNGEYTLLQYTWSPPLSTWHHVAYTFDDTHSVESLYVDGALVASAPSTGPIAYDAEPFQIGADIDDSVVRLFLNGSIDEVSLYDRALSVPEIQAIYHAGSFGKYNTNSLLPNFQVAIDGYSTNLEIVTNFAGPWQPFTNSFIATNNAITVEFAGNTLSTLLDDIELVQLPNTNYNNSYLPEESMNPLIGQNPQGCWTLQVTDTRNDSSVLSNGTLISWDLQMTISSTNVNLIVLTNGIPFREKATVGITYFAVDVPLTATFATNTLTVNNANPLNLLFSQTSLPTGSLPGDVTLLSGVSTATGPEASTLATQGLPPPLVPGQRYFLGVQNNNAASVPFTLTVNFNIATNQVTVLSNGVAVNTNVSSAVPEYYSFVVPPEASMVTFQVLNGPANTQLALYAREGLPVPGPLSYDYESLDAGSSDQIIVVTTNSVPVPLPSGNLSTVVPPGPATWYLAVYNFAGAANAGYTILATYVLNGGMDVIALKDGIPFTNTAAIGFPTNLVYSFTVNNNPGGLEFIVTNLSNVGSVELLAAEDMFPTPQSFYAGSFNSGTQVQTISIGTSASLPSLDGTWYLAAPNPSGSVVTYTITADTAGGGAAAAGPLLLATQITSPTNGFTMYWSSNPGQTYTVDVSTDLLQWTLVTNVTAASTMSSYTDAVPVESQKTRFFRLSVP